MKLTKAEQLNFVDLAIESAEKNPEYDHLCILMADLFEKAGHEESWGKHFRKLLLAIQGEVAQTGGCIYIHYYSLGNPSNLSKAEIHAIEREGRIKFLKKFRKKFADGKI